MTVSVVDFVPDFFLVVPDGLVVMLLPPLPLAAQRVGTGRELFALLRNHAGSAETGACALFVEDAGGPGVRA